MTRLDQFEARWRHESRTCSPAILNAVAEGFLRIFPEFTERQIFDYRTTRPMELDSQLKTFFRDPDGLRDWSKHAQYWSHAGAYLRLLPAEERALSAWAPIPANPSRGMPAFFDLPLRQLREHGRYQGNLAAQIIWAYNTAGAKNIRRLRIA